MLTSSRNTRSTQFNRHLIFYCQAKTQSKSNTPKQLRDCSSHSNDFPRHLSSFLPFIMLPVSPWTSHRLAWHGGPSTAGLRGAPFRALLSGETAPSPSTPAIGPVFLFVCLLWPLRCSCSLVKGADPRRPGLQFWGHRLAPLGKGFPSLTASPFTPPLRGKHSVFRSCRLSADRKSASSTEPPEPATWRPREQDVAVVRASEHREVASLAEPRGCWGISRVTF